MRSRIDKIMELRKSYKDYGERANDLELADFSDNRQLTADN